MDHTAKSVKKSNPKDDVAVGKVPLTSVVPTIAHTVLALAHYEGAQKYGPFNWRGCGVRTSVYLDAAHRHLAKFQEGEWEDPDTGVPHLGSVMACCSIIMDAWVNNKLTDDRPLTSPTAVHYLDHLATRVLQSASASGEPGGPRLAAVEPLSKAGVGSAPPPELPSDTERWASED